MSWLESTDRHPSAASFAVCLAASCAILAFANFQGDAAGGAESRFLGLLAGGVLATITALARPPAIALHWTAVLVTTTIWIVDYGPHRGAVVTVLLALGLAGAAVGRLQQMTASSLPLATTLPLAIGLQLLARCDLLLPPLLDARTLISLLALPIGVAIALSLLAVRFSPSRALLVGGVVFVLSPGWNVTVTLALLALAAGTVLADSCAPRWQRAVATVVLLMPLFWSPALGLLITLGGLYLLVPARWMWLPTGAAVAALLLLPGMRSVWETSALALRGMLILPSLLAAPRAGLRWALAGGVFLVASARLGAGPEALATGVALAALGTPTAHTFAGLQRAWCGALVAATVLLATYPWRRQDPLLSALEGFGLRVDGRGLLLLGIVFFALGYGLDRLRQGRFAPWARRPTLWAGATLLTALTLSLPAAGTVPLSYQTAVLSLERPTWSFRPTPNAPITGVVVDANMVHGFALPPGTPLAIVQLLDEDGRPQQIWQLRAGDHLAEWAAARPDIAAQAAFAPPPSWLAYIAPDGSFFGQRFRSRLQTPGAIPAHSIMIQRDARLPPQVQVILYRVELRT